MVGHMFLPLESFFRLCFCQIGKGEANSFPCSLPLTEAVFLDLDPPSRDNLRPPLYSRASRSIPFIGSSDFLIQRVILNCQPPLPHLEATLVLTIFVLSPQLSKRVPRSQSSHLHLWESIYFYNVCYLASKPSRLFLTPISGLR